MRVHHERKSDGVRVHYEKSQSKRGNGVRVDHEKKSHGGELTMRKSHGVRVHHKKEPWGES